MPTTPYALDTIPLFPPRSIESRLRHFSDTFFKVGEDSEIFRFVDALCGDAGAGSLKKKLLVQRLSARLDTLYFGDIDNIFGNLAFLTRMPSESYDYDPSTDMLTQEQWDEIRTKDAWYRARIKDFFVACGLGGTPEALRMMSMAALGVPCDLYEVWRVADHYGIEDSSIGRSPVVGQPYRNEVVIRPHKEFISAKERHTLLHMVDKIRPVDTIVTVDTEGLATHSAVEVRTIAASSTYFEIRKEVTGTQDLSKLPPPEVLAQDIGPTQAWLRPGVPVTAPTTAFNSTQEYSVYYLRNKTEWDQISTVDYESISEDGTRRPEAPHTDTIGGEEYRWIAWPIADSPDNFPGGKNGVNPYQAPALNPNGTPYLFMHSSQQEMIDEMTEAVLASGGIVSDYGYAYPEGQLSSVYTWAPDSAIATREPVTDTTVSTSWV